MASKEKNKTGHTTGGEKELQNNDVESRALIDGVEYTSDSKQEDLNQDKLLYTISDIPPWYTCIVLGFQHYLTMFGATVSVPLILSTSFCMHTDYLGISELIGTVFFVSGIATLLQSTVGNRLPIVQGTTFAFLPPTFAILSLPMWQCPFIENKDNITLPEVGGPEHRDMWQSRIREIQGAVLVASLFQVVIGFSGIIGILLRFIGPLAVTPTVTLVGLAIFRVAADKCATQWWISITTMVIIIIFSQYLRNIDIPFCGGRRAPIFKLFPVILGIGVSWLICYILTITDTLPEFGDTDGWGYKARTDIRSDVLTSAPWFEFPYPGQWGVPTVSVAAVFGMLAGVLASMIESVGDYYACARLSGAPPPPTHAINRGIGIEGIGCVLAGAWGTGNGTTSFSENIGAIGITRVGSRVVVQVGAALMLILGCLGKFGALFVTIPDPVIGGMFMIMFAMITAVGLSNLQFVDLNSSRNLFVLGFSLFFGISVPMWVTNNPGAIQTGPAMAPSINDCGLRTLIALRGSAIVDQILSVLCGTSMLVGGVLGLVLDNTIPGTIEERGIRKWRELSTTKGTESTVDMSCYDFPLIQKYLDKVSWFRYIPFCPAFSRDSEKLDIASGETREFGEPETIVTAV